MAKWIVKIPYEGTAEIPIESDNKPIPMSDPIVSNRMHTNNYWPGLTRFFRNKAEVEEADDKWFESVTELAKSEFNKKSTYQTKVAAAIDRVAESLESMGLLLEAEEVDAIANTVDAGLFSGHEPTKEEIEGLRRMVSDKVRSNPGYLASKIEVTWMDPQGRFLKKIEDRLRTREKPPQVGATEWREGPDGYWYLQELDGNHRVEFVGDKGYFVGRGGKRIEVPSLEVVNIVAMSKEEEPMVSKLSSMLDAVADSLEAKGFLKEAAEIDTISNAVDEQERRMYNASEEEVKAESKINALKQPPEVIRALKTLAKKISGELLDQILDTLSRDVIISGMREAEETKAGEGHLITEEELRVNGQSA